VSSGVFFKKCFEMEEFIFAAKETTKTVKTTQTTLYPSRRKVAPDSRANDNKMQNHLLDGKYFKINSVNDTKMNVPRCVV